MELTIPTSASQVSNNSVAPNSSQTNTSYNSFAQSDADNSYQADDYEESKLLFADEFGFGFLNKSNLGNSATAFSLGISFGVNYNIIADLYVGGRIGYFGAYYDNKIVSTDVHCISIPIEVGYVFSTENRKFGINPFMGFNFNIGLTGKQKYNSHANVSDLEDYGSYFDDYMSDYSDEFADAMSELNDESSKKFKVGGKLMLDYRIGVRFNICSFDVGISYHVPLNDDFKKYLSPKAYPEISIGYGF
jgi:hypothetical protein